jgi:predicted membrane-bound spermidine synthase
MPPRTARVASLLFGSGFCALVYQTAWLREFRLIFGASTAASAAVVAIFIGGLGVGGLVIGRRADTHALPLWLYARLEALIALSAALTPWLLALAREGYVAVGGSVVLGLAGGSVARLLLATLVLAVPTFLMGGTLPAAARAVATSDDAGRRGVALLYGVNTLGAVAGAIAGTFFMLEVFGTRRALWLACLLNLLVAMAARRMARTLPPEAGGPTPAQEGEQAGAPVGFVLAGSAVVGFAFFLMELIWYRMLGPILGGTVFTFGLILSVALLGIGLGGAAYSLLRGNRPATLLGFAHTCLLEAGLIALPYALGDRVAVFAGALRPLGGVGQLWGYVLGWTLVCGLVVLPAAIVAGYQFPLLIGLLGRGRSGVGRHVGLAYAWNTVGAIVGSLAGGFGLIPLLSAPGAWRATVLTLLALGVASLALARRGGEATLRLAPPAALLLAVALLLQATGPTAVWRHSGIGAGRARLPLASPNVLEDWKRLERGRIVWQADGVESSVALAAVGPGVAFFINGKNDGNSRGDAPTMVMSGLLGAFLHPRPRSALVIGLGTGGTAGWLAAVPEIERVDVVELEPRVLDVARDCRSVNQAVLESPKVHVTLGDAREALLVTPRRYDVIFSEPSNPYRAGIASLFTREYYQAVQERLEQGGLFLQWVQAYEVDGATIRTVYATLQSVFPVVESWQVSRGDLILLASREPLAKDVPELRRRLTQEPYRSALRRVWAVEDLEGFLAYFVARPALARAIAEREAGRVNTDDLNLVEFGFARTLGRQGLFGIPALRETAVLRGEQHPEVTGGEVDWSRVEDQRMVFFPSETVAPAIWARLTPSQRSLASFLASGLSCPTALGAWRQVGRDPVTRTELLTLAACLAETGDERAAPWIERLRGHEPLEAETLTALLRARQGKADEALAAVEVALDGYRENPWPEPFVIRQAVVVAGDLASGDPARARRLLPRLSRPFALRGSEEARLVALAQALTRLAPGPECVEVLRSLEPNVPWIQDWLGLRQRCYAAAGTGAEAAGARADLLAFLEEEPPRFYFGLLPAATR